MNPIWLILLRWVGSTTNPFCFGDFFHGFDPAVVIFFSGNDFFSAKPVATVVNSWIEAEETILLPGAWDENHQHLETTIWATKNTLTTFHYTGCLIGILFSVFYNAYITGEYNALYTPTNQVFFIAHLEKMLKKNFFQASN